MAGAALLGRLNWLVADVVDVVTETPRVRTIAFDVAGWPGHNAGQHVDVRLTAEDGYQAQRSYSIASAPDGTRIELTVERLDDGEVSPYLTDELRRGDQIELRGPIGGYFVWKPAQARRAREVDAGEVRVRQRGVADRGAGAGKHVDDAVRQPGRLEQVHHEVRREQRGRGRLPEHDVADERRPTAGCRRSR